MASTRLNPEYQAKGNYAVLVGASSFSLNKPSGSNTYGTIFRSGTPPSDTYYLFIDASRHMYIGTQLNGASTITWRTIAS